MISILDCINDKSNYTTIGGGMLSAFIGMMLWVFPFLNASGFWAVFGTISMTAFSTLVVFIVTGVCKRHEKKILDFVDNKVFFLNRKSKKNGNKKNDKAA